MNRTTLILSALILILAGASYFLMIADSPEENQRAGWAGRTVSVKVKPAGVKEFSDVVRAIGNARARESVMITSRVSDTVSKIHFDDGDVVKKGQLLVSIVREEEQALLSEAQANLLEAEKQLTRIKDLVTQGNASQATLEAAVRRSAEAKFRVKAITARLEDRLIRAPFDGVLGLRQISEGSLINQNTVITTIDAIDRIKLDFSVPERFISVLKKGQAVDASVDAYGGERFTGTVISVDSRIDPATRAVQVRAEVMNKDLRLKPGMLMTVQLIADTWSSVYVQEESVVTIGGTHYVYVISDTNEAERRRIELGLRRAGYVEVKQGIIQGESVVTEGVIRLGQGGMRVTIVTDPDQQSQSRIVNKKNHKEKSDNVSGATAGGV